MYTSSSPGLTLLDEGRSSIHKKSSIRQRPKADYSGDVTNNLRKQYCGVMLFFMTSLFGGGGWVMHYGIEETGKLETSITCRVMYDEHKQEQWDKKL